MRTWNSFIEEIPDEEFKIMIENYEQLERDSCIGDCLLRTRAEEWGEIADNSHIVFIMRDITFEGCRRFAKRYLANEKKIDLILK